MTTSRTNTPTEQNKEDNSLILYRIEQVEKKLDGVNSKLDRQDTIKRQDLKDFQETIVTRFLDMRTDLQKQIDGKADSSELADLKKLFFSVMGFLSSIMVALVIGYLTTGK